VGNFQFVGPGSDLQGLLLNSKFLNALIKLVNESGTGGAVPGELLRELKLVEVMISTTIPGCTYDAAARKRTPQWTTQPRVYTKAGVDQWHPDCKYSFYSKSIEGITVSSGKGKFGMVLNRNLIVVDCEEVSLT